MFNSASERIRDIFQTEKVANSSNNDVPRLNIARTSQRGSGKIAFCGQDYNLETNVRHLGFVKYFGHFLLRSTKLTISSQFYISTINVTIKENLFQLTP